MIPEQFSCLPQKKARLQGSSEPQMLRCCRPDDTGERVPEIEISIVMGKESKVRGFTSRFHAMIGHRCL